MLYSDGTMETNGPAEVYPNVTSLHIHEGQLMIPEVTTLSVGYGCEPHIHEDGSIVLKPFSVSSISDSDRGTAPLRSIAKRAYLAASA